LQRESGQEAILAQLRDPVPAAATQTCCRARRADIDDTTGDGDFIWSNAAVPHQSGSTGDVRNRDGEGARAVHGRCALAIFALNTRMGASIWQRNYVRVQTSCGDVAATGDKVGFVGAPTTLTT
jgi:hypothetical protein